MIYTAVALTKPDSLRQMCL